MPIDIAHLVKLTSVLRRKIYHEKKCFGFLDFYQRLSQKSSLAAHKKKATTFWTERIIFVAGKKVQQQPKVLL